MREHNGILYPESREERAIADADTSAKRAALVVEHAYDSLGPAVHDLTPYDDLCEIIRLSGAELKKHPPYTIVDRLCKLIEDSLKILRML